MITQIQQPNETYLCKQESSLLLTANIEQKQNGLVIMPPRSLFSCQYCEKIFGDETILEYHLKDHEQLQQQYNHSIHQSESQESQKIINQEETITVMIYGCEKCGQTFTSDSDFQKHSILAECHSVNPSEGQKQFMCDLCSYSSSHKENLINHQQNDHNHEYKYQCEICGLGFYDLEGYEGHQMTHSLEKYQCEVCQATFRYKQGLRLHAKLHQPDYVAPPKKHCCQLCNKRFCRKQVLLVHMKTHGNIAPTSEYICHICGKSVSSKTYLTVHVRKHTGEKPHVCDLCGKGFISQNYLSVHRRTHTGERPHKCLHCNKSFTQRTTLVVHTRSHTGDKPYPCNCCQKSFASKTMLNSHLKTHAKQIARAEQEQRTQINLQQQNLLLPP